MNEICIIGYGTLGRKVFEALSLKEKIKIYNRTKVKLRNIKKNQKFDNIDEFFKKSKIIIFLVKDENAIRFYFSKLRNKKLLKNKIFVNLSTISYIESRKFDNKTNTKPNKVTSLPLDDQTQNEGGDSEQPSAETKQEP
mgnify:CR=1 FL=1